MAKKTMTLDMLKAMFDAEDSAPIKIVRTTKNVTASRDDVTVTTAMADATIAPNVGEFSLIFGADGGFGLVPVAKAEKTTRQSPAFDSL